MAKFRKKVTEWPRDSRLTVTLTVKQFFRRFSKNGNIFKKVAVRRSSDSRRSHDLFIRLDQNDKILKNIAERWSEVTRYSADRRMTSDECRLTVQRFSSKFVIFAETSNKILTVDRRSPAA